MSRLLLQTTALAAWLFLALAENDTITVGDQSRRLDKNGCTYLPWKKETECTGPRVDAKFKRKENLADERDSMLKAEAAQRNYELSIKASPGKGWNDGGLLTKKQEREIKVASEQFKANRFDIESIKEARNSGKNSDTTKYSGSIISSKDGNQRQTSRGFEDTPVSGPLKPHSSSEGTSNAVHARISKSAAASAASTATKDTRAQSRVSPQEDASQDGGQTTTSQGSGSLAHHFAMKPCRPGEPARISAAATLAQAPLPVCQAMLRGSLSRGSTSSSSTTRPRQQPNAGSHDNAQTPHSKGSRQLLSSKHAKKTAPAAPAAPSSSTSPATSNVATKKPPSTPSKGVPAVGYGVGAESEALVMSHYMCQLCIVGTGFEERAASTAALLTDAVRLLEQEGQKLSPFRRMLFHIGDVTCNRQHSLAYAVHNNRTCAKSIRAVPDFTFQAWPSAGVNNYTTEAAKVAAAGTKRAQRPVQCGWAGNIRSHPIRKVYAQMAQEHPGLLEAHQPPDWTHKGPGGGSKLSFSDMARRWGCLVDLPGRGYSGRIPLLMHSGRPLLYVARPDVVWYTRSDWRPPAKPSFSSSRTSKTSSSTTIATAPLSDAARESLMRKAREAGNAAVARLQAQQATTGLDNGNQPEEQQQPQRMASEENQIQEAKHSSSASSTSHAVNFTSAETGAAAAVPPQEEQTTPMPKQLQVQSSQLRRQLPEKKPWAPWRKKSKASSGSSSGSGGSSDFETGGGGTAGLRARAGADFMDKINEGPWQPWVHYIPVLADLSDLEEKTRWVGQNQAEAKLIGLRAQQLAQKHLTRSAAVAFLARELRFAAMASPAHPSPSSE